MKAKMIGTWKMAYDAISLVKDKADINIVEAMLEAISYIDDNKDIHTVGSYSRPNEEGYLQLDGGFMDYSSKVGAVIEARHIAHPATLAYDLSKYNSNIVLAGEGADKFGNENDICYVESLPVYLEDTTVNHDTFGVVGNDDGKLYTAISSSGRSGKKVGRVGDSPLVGSGFYCDEYAGCVATGDGEAILRGVLSKEVVTRVSLGQPIGQAMEEACKKQFSKLDYDADYCMVGIDSKGNFAAYSTLSLFPFAVLFDEGIKLYFYVPEKGIFEADEKLLEQYKGD